MAGSTKTTTETQAATATDAGATAARTPKAPAKGAKKAGAKKSKARTAKRTAAKKVAKRTAGKAKGAGKLGPIALVNQIADSMPDARRRDVVAAAIDAGVNPATARSQYQVWYSKNKR